ncbi:ferredoxin reductase [Pseudonocardia ailaonensis]|uniref:Ferredoxin reductase n=1 Tax=Pseudonocardia ailaonensis TaxID=367279 RepID=A0ABN2MNC4_9PSEU
MAGPWQQATVVGIRRETPTATTFRLALERPFTHVAGQYVVLRLSAPDGYTAQRDYSISSVPGSPELQITVEHLPGGEVSEFLHEVVEVGDELELRGPIGGHFAWAADGPALGIGGGSGVVPLMSMLRQARATGQEDLFRLVVSVRRPVDLYFAAEITGPRTTVVHTRQEVAGRAAGRLTAADLAPALGPDGPIYVCGTPPFCDTVTELLTGLGAATARIRVERFGPTGT